ncbi:MAG TPA: hypothetical protein VK980_03085 [Sphingomonas sp.]|nr:hypothetical protein [Sphingomonas sp.]
MRQDSCLCEMTPERDEGKHLADTLAPGGTLVARVTGDIHRHIASRAQRMGSCG